MLLFLGCDLIVETLNAVAIELPRAASELLFFGNVPSTAYSCPWQRVLMSTRKSPHEVVHVLCCPFRVVRFVRSPYTRRVTCR